MTRVRDERAGLTLLETMIALFVMAIMAGLVAQVTGNGVAILTRSGAMQADLEFAMARRDLRLWIEDTLTIAPPDDTRQLFVGRPDGFVALTLPIDSPFWPGRAVAVEVSTLGEVSAFGSSEEGINLQLRSRIAPEGARLLVRYWGRPRPEAPPEWQESWQGGAGPPELVKIHIINITGRPLPPLTIQPAKRQLQREMSLSSLVPPARPSRP